MEKILNELYSYEYFSVYLIVSIIILVLLFIIILFFGKKDQKEREIEATKKLQQINEDAFKDDSITEKVEINNITQDRLENDTIIVPSIEEIEPNVMATEEHEVSEPEFPALESFAPATADLNPIEEDLSKEEEKIPVMEPVLDVPTVIEEAQNKPIIEEKINENIGKTFEEFSEPTFEPVEATPILEKVEEKPLAFDNFNFNLGFEEPVSEKPEIITPEPKIEPEVVSVPLFNFDEIIKDVEETKKEEPVSKEREIFSSVYVPEKKVENHVSEKIQKEEDEEFELPTLKKEVVEEKKEPIDMPVLNDYNLDNLSGEEYDINK